MQDKITKARVVKVYIPFLFLLLKDLEVFFFSSALVAYLGHVNISIWHQRLGHPTNTVVQRMLQDSALSVSIDSSQALCTACLHNKMHKLSFPKDHVKSSVPF